MERGVIELFPKTNFTTTSAEEDFIAYLQVAAQRFCDVFGMVIYEDLTTSVDKRISVYVGYANDSHPLFRLCNWDYSNNYTSYFGICLTTDMGAQPPTNTNNSNYQKYQFCYTTSYPVYMVYMKDGKNIVFALNNAPSAPNYMNDCKWIVTQAEYGDGSSLVSVPFAMHIYNEFVYASSDARIGFASDSYAFKTTSEMLSNVSPILPRTKEAIIDQNIYLYNTDDVKVTDLRLYSNKMGMPNGSIMKIAGVRYFLIYRYNANFPTILLKLEA